MRHEILSVKLYELNKRLAEMQSRILICQNADRHKIKQELENARDECEKNDMILRTSLARSRSPEIITFSEMQLEISEWVHTMQQQLEPLAATSEQQEKSIEKKILFAEYTLDYAMQMADYAILASLTAIDSQIESEENNDERSEIT